MNDRVSTPHNIACRQVLEFLRSELSLSGCVIYNYSEEHGVVDFIAGSLPGVVEGKSNTSLETISRLIHTGRCNYIVPDASQSAYSQHSVFCDSNPVAIVAIPIVVAGSSQKCLLCGVSFDLQANDQQNSDLLSRRPLLEFCKAQIEHANESYLRSLEDIYTIEYLTDQAYQDAMTCLLNRNGWEAAIASVIGNGFGFHECVTVFVIDVDGLKALNDTKGHAAGDNAIRTVATTLQRYFKIEDGASLTVEMPFIARTGGDEFFGLLFDCDDEAAQAVARSMSHELLQRGVSVSIGFACCRSARKLPDAIVNADEAMYLQKSRLEPMQHDLLGDQKVSGSN